MITQTHYQEDEVFTMQKQALKQQHFILRSTTNKEKYQIVKLPKYSKHYETIKDNLCYNTAVEALKRINKF